MTGKVEPDWASGRRKASRNFWVRQDRSKIVERILTELVEQSGPPGISYKRREPGKRQVGVSFEVKMVAEAGHEEDLEIADERIARAAGFNSDYTEVSN